MCVLSALLTLFGEADKHISVLPSFKIVESQLTDNYRSYFSQPGYVVSFLRSFEQLVKDNRISPEAVKRTKEFLNKDTDQRTTGATSLLRQYLETALRYYSLTDSTEGLHQSLSSVSTEPKGLKAARKRPKTVTSLNTPKRISRDFDVPQDFKTDLTKEFHEFIKDKLQRHKATHPTATKPQAISYALGSQKDWLQQFNAVYSNASRTGELFTSPMFKSEVLACVKTIKFPQATSNKQTMTWGTHLMQQERKRLERKCDWTLISASPRVL